MFQIVGDYLYFGVESGLLKILSQHIEKFSGERLCISFNIDGVLLFKSTNTQLWPILCSLEGFEPFIVALFVEIQSLIHWTIISEIL